MQTTVQIPDELIQKLSVIACKYRPFEACGLLMAENSINSILIREIRVCHNLAKNKMAHFRLSRNDLREAESVWRTRKNRIVGIYHTHGIGSSEPSIHDRLTMRSRPGLYLIADTRGEFRAFVSKFNHLLPAEVSIH